MRARLGLSAFFSSGVIATAGVALTSTAHAIPPRGPSAADGGRGFVEGANHHVGDASFEAAFGRAPTARDGEPVRMHEHLQWIHDQLAAGTATRPELAARRAQLLGYLQDYVNKGTTPLNVDLGWRNPVFIDSLGTICAVGYLVEQSAGRDLAEAIAAAHRYDYIDDIARAMPEVAAWIEGSGFTLEEIASIQPGYIAPAIDMWEYLRKPPMDGPVTHGAGRVVNGSGELKKGKGTWTSRYGNGQILAQGPMRGGHPHGEWRFYHPSGNLAAEGDFFHGARSGAWRFYDDTPAATVIAEGRFKWGSYAGTWKHNDASGALFAKTYDVRSRGYTEGGEHVLDYTAKTDPGVRVRVHEGNVAGDLTRIRLVDVEGERFAVNNTWDDEQPTYVDSRGRELQRLGEGAWRRSLCPVDPGLRAAVKSGTLEKAHGAIWGDASAEGAPACEASETVDEKTAARVERVWAAFNAPDQPDAPTYIARLEALNEAAQSAMNDLEPSDDDADATQVAGDQGTDDSADAATDDAATDEAPAKVRLVDALEDGMTWYTEFRHIDRLFELVFATLPDRVLGDGMPDDPSEESDGTTTGT